MSKEFLDRLARGQLTNTRDYRRMTNALNEMKQKEDTATETKEAQEWQTWELAPVWSSCDPKDNKKAEDGIRADSVHRALGRLDES